MFEDVKTVLFDLDGTVYYGSSIIPGANDAIKHCKACGKQVFFLSNNSTKTRRQVFDKLIGMDIHCEYSEVLTSGYVAALYAHKEHLDNIYLCGSEHLASEFAGLDVNLVDAEKAENLVIGYDPTFDYAKLTKATRVALRANKIIACNKEKTYLGEGAKLFPGCGGMVAPIEWCADRTCDYVIGKPNTLMLDIIGDTLHLENDEMLVVGDTYGSDILMANKKGCPSVLVGNQEYSDTVTVERIGELVNLIR